MYNIIDTYAMKEKCKMSLYHKEAKDWTGFKVNNITVIEKIGEINFKSSSKLKDYTYITDILSVQCETCGEKRECQAKSLIANNTIGCRHCAARQEAVNKKSGKLTVVSYEYRRQPCGRPVLYYVCDCDCGGKHTVKSDIFNSGDSVHCKECHQSSKFIPSKALKKRTMKKYLGTIMYRCKKTNIEFGMTLEFLNDLLDKQGDKCSLSNQPISIEEGTASLDRKDNKIGYIESNVQWVHRSINYMKNELDEQVFISWCKFVSDHKSIN